MTFRLGKCAARWVCAFVSLLFVEWNSPFSIFEYVKSHSSFCTQANDGKRLKSNHFKHGFERLNWKYMIDNSEIGSCINIRNYDALSSVSWASSDIESHHVLLSTWWIFNVIQCFCSLFESLKKNKTVDSYYKRILTSKCLSSMILINFIYLKMLHLSFSI